MIATGLYTSLGFQVIGLNSGFAILMLWIVGGVLVLCGAFVYGEIGSAFPESGGKYKYLSKLYHPAVGFFKWLGKCNRWLCRSYCGGIGGTIAIRY